MKILVTGPTGDELKKYSNIIGKHYRIPYITIDDVLNSAPSLLTDEEKNESDWLAEDYAEDKA